MYLYNDADHSVRQVRLDMALPWGEEQRYGLGTLCPARAWCGMTPPFTRACRCYHVDFAGASVAHGKLHELHISDTVPANGRARCVLRCVACFVPRLACVGHRSLDKGNPSRCLGTTQ